MIIDKKVAIVSGASSGLGEALTNALVANGATVYGLARNAEKLDTIRKKLGNAFIPFAIDITDPKATIAWVKRTFSDSHIPDILINNAGAGYFSKIDQLPLERWHAMINTNLNGMFYLTTSIVPMMKKSANTCHIINIGSILGKTNRAQTAAYSATKYGVQGFSEALYKELSRYKIKVTCVNPGSIATHFFDDSGILPYPSYLQPKDIAELIVKIIETPDNFLVDEITLRPLIEHSSA
jgi:NADP-dependent 3-hydroxy acid dehydrogenase YdfG